MTPAEETAASTGLGLAKLAWTSLWAAFGKMKLLFGGMMVFSMIVAAIFSYASGELTQSRDSVQGMVALLLTLPQFFLLAIIVAPAMIALHRFILLDRATSSAALMKESYERSFILWFLGFNLLLILAGALVGLVDALWPGSAIPSIAIVLAGAAGAIRLVLIFPAIATEVPSAGWRDRIEASWDQMRGRFWLFVRGYILIALPIGLVFAPLEVALKFLGTAKFGDSGATSLGVNVLDAFAQNVLLLVTAALASWLYAGIRRAN